MQLSEYVPSLFRGSAREKDAIIIGWTYGVVIGIIIGMLWMIV